MNEYLGHRLTLVHMLGESAVFVDSVGNVVLGIRKGDDGWVYATVTDVDVARNALAVARAHARSLARVRIEEATDAPS